MKESFSQWLSRRTQLRGVFACGIRFPDKTSLTQSWSPEFTASPLENAWRCAGDALQVLGAGSLPNERVHWVYEKALLYCVRREDGTWLGIFTAKDPGAVDAGEIERLRAEFCALRVDAPGS